MRARRRTLPDDDVELVILERGIQDLFQRRLQPVHFIEHHPFALQALEKALRVGHRTALAGELAVKILDIG